MRSTNLPTFYLVQRLESRPAVSQSKQGFDAYFALSYMGASEFEWGAVPRALESMRERPAVVEMAPVRIGGSERDVYFVGHEGVSRFCHDLELWATGSEHRRPFYGKEYTRFGEAFAGEVSEFDHTDAWWDLETDIAWALSKEVAEKLRLAFESRRM